MSDAHQLSPEDQLNEARWMMEDHTPANQDHNFNRTRCALCDFTRHPCDVYDLAAWFLAAVEGDSE